MQAGEGRVLPGPRTFGSPPKADNFCARRAGDAARRRHEPAARPAHARHHPRRARNKDDLIQRAAAQRRHGRVRRRRRCSGAVRRPDGPVLRQGKRHAHGVGARHAAAAPAAQIARHDVRRRWHGRRRVAREDSSVKRAIRTTKGACIARKRWGRRRGRQRQRRRARLRGMRAEEPRRTRDAPILRKPEKAPAWYAYPLFISVL